MLYHTRYILRLCRTRSIYQNERFHFARASNGNKNTTNDDIHAPRRDFTSLFEKYKEKITFNSHLEHDKLELGYFKYYMRETRRARRAVARDFKERSLPPLPIALQYLVDEDRLLQATAAEVSPEPENSFQLPYSSTTQPNILKDSLQEETQNDTLSKVRTDFDRSNIDRWMTNYEHFDDTKLQQDAEEDVADFEWSKQYGTPDPSAGISRVPCGGCGALLHCSDPAIPGYLPSEIFKDSRMEDLKTVECQRCHFLKEYNIALDVNVEPEEYEKLLQSIRHYKSLVVLMVDLLDYPCSIWPGIINIIGTERPLIVVGNKVDLLPGDSIGYLKRVRASFISEIKKTRLRDANIKHVSLISAKTGYGVESLISAMFKIWLAKGDVFLVGCTNVGKSSLFNALMQSDYCKVHAVDIIKRATVSRWPGTTLNLLKFPINRPSGWKIHQRNERLKADSRLMKVEKEIRKAHIEDTRAVELPTLIGHIGRTFSDPQEFSAQGDIPEKRRQMIGLDEREEVFAKSKWFYDTPGVIHPDQVLSLLTTEELLMAVPKKVLRPQTYYLHPGSTLFIGGLARMDFVECSEPCRFTIFCSEGLPITVTKTEDADEVYEQFLGTELFGAPLGGAQRLANWPGLKKHEELIEFTGEGPKACCGDIVLSSVAWISVTAKMRSRCKITAWTPEGRGIHRRHPSVLPMAINLKGKRLRDTPAYMLGKVFIDDNYLRDHGIE